MVESSPPAQTQSLFYDEVKERRRAGQMMNGLINSAIRESVKTIGRQMRKDEVMATWKASRRLEKVASARGVDIGSQRWHAIMRGARRNLKNKRITKKKTKDIKVSTPIG